MDSTSQILKTLNAQMDGGTDMDDMKSAACCRQGVGSIDKGVYAYNRTGMENPLDRVSPVVEPERVLGVYEPVRVMQCCNCASFYLEGEQELNCPECGCDDAEKFGDIVPVEDRDFDEDEEEEGYSEEEEMLNLDLDESLDLLNAHRVREFSRRFGDKARLKGRNLYMVNEGLRSRPQRLNRNQIKAFNLSRLY